MRFVKEKDLGSVFKIEKLCFGSEAYSPSLFSYFLTTGFVFLVAEFKGLIIGYCVAEVRNSEGLIISIAVHPKYRGMGAGSALLSKVLSLLDSKRVEKVFLQVKKENKAAVNLYSKFGFEVLKVLKNYYMDGSDAYFMQLLLKHSKTVKG